MLKKSYVIEDPGIFNILFRETPEFFVLTHQEQQEVIWIKRI